MKQLDFLGRLTAAITPKATRPEPATQKSPSGEDELLRQQACELLHAAGATELAMKVRVCWNPRMRSTAGTALIRSALVTLNPALLQFGDEEVDRTLRHELAHLLAHDRAGRRRIAPHGPEWRRACADLGLAGEARCHTLPLPRRTLERRHRYRCPKCAVEIKRVRPLRGANACLSCCRKYNSGKYDDRFRLVRVRD